MTFVVSLSPRKDFCFTIVKERHLLLGFLLGNTFVLLLPRNFFAFSEERLLLLHFCLGKTFVLLTLREYFCFNFK